MRKNLLRLRSLFHPIAMFVVAQVSWGLLMFVWIRWYVLRNREIELTIKDLPIGERMQTVSGIILIQGCLLMGIILLGLYFIFLAFRRQVSLNKLQHGILDSVTHELKTPLAAIRLHAETLLIRNLPEETRSRFLRKSLVEVERLQRLIDGVLVSARLESGSMGGERDEYDIVELVEGAWERLRDRAGDSRRFVFEKRATAFRMVASLHQMEMLFDNLLDNAFKYTSSGVSITLEVALTPRGLGITVSDEGCGLAKQDLKRIFRKFVRIEGGGARQISGSGLGLYVCESIVKAHGGRIWAASDGIGKGAAFHVELPRTDRHR